MLWTREYRRLDEEMTISREDYGKIQPKYDAD